MKISQLFEDDQEPLMITILRNAMEKGKQVRVYYRGDGGLVKTIEWDPPAPLRNQGNGTETRVGNGASSFKTVDDRWVVIGDHNLEKLVLTKREERGVEVLTLKQEAGRTVKEGMSDGRDWINKTDAEFKAVITVPGSVSEQKFEHGTWFPTDGQKHVMVLRMLGQIGEAPVAAPVLVTTKIECPTCGKKNKSNVKFCSECGTGLINV